MKLAYTMMDGRGDMDLLLASLADALTAEGIACSGVVQINTECGPDRPCDMDLRILPTDETLRISQTLGVGARGCRLDPDALEHAVARTMAQLPKSDLLIINKFGKHEALGRGFRPLIAEAIAMELPVLCGVNGANLEAFTTFTDGLAQRVAPDLSALRQWAVPSV